VNPLHAGSSIEEVAATVSEALAAAGITAVLSGGAVVQIYSEGLYVSQQQAGLASAGDSSARRGLRQQSLLGRKTANR